MTTARRRVIQSLAGGLITVVAGCGDRYGSSTPTTTLTFSLVWESTEKGYRIDGETIVRDGTMHEVTVLAADQSGNVLDRVSIETLDSDAASGTEARAETVLPTDQFPKAVTATAAESVCDDYRISVAYIVASPGPSDGRPWEFGYENTFRDCGENTFPAQVLAEVPTVTPSPDQLPP